MSLGFRHRYSSRNVTSETSTFGGLHKEDYSISGSILGSSV